MTRARIIFYSVFGAYQFLAFVFTLVMESSASVLFKLVGIIGWFKYITFIGFALIVADFIWLWMDQKKHKKIEEASRHENNLLKAKVYDFQEGAKVKQEIPKAN